MILKHTVTIVLLQLLLFSTASRAQEQGPWWTWPTIDGNWFGYRHTLADYGLVFSGATVVDLQGNASGLGFLSERRLRLRARIVRAPDTLVEVNRSSRHHPGLIAGQERNGARHLHGIEQSAEGLPRGGFFEPFRGPAMIDLLRVEFAFRGHPTNVEAVHPDAVA